MHRIINQALYVEIKQLAAKASLFLAFKGTAVYVEELCTVKLTIYFPSLQVHGSISSAGVSLKHSKAGSFNSKLEIFLSSIISHDAAFTLHSSVPSACIS